MDKLWGSLISVIVLFALTAVSCSGGGSGKTQVTDLTVTRTVGTENEPTSSTDVVPASAPSIYLSGRISKPTKNSSVRIIWLKLPNEIVASEDFTGNRSSSNQFEFDQKLSTSFFASKIDRTGISWQEGEYRADTYLAGRMVDSLFFKIVSDGEADATNNRRIISKVSFGDVLSDTGTIETSKTTFERSAGHIYIQIALAGTQPGAKIEASVRNLKENKVINTFTTTTGRDVAVLFDLGLSQFGRLWTDRLWPSGGYQVEIKVNGTSAITPSFVIE